jgi:hypothetical protein
MSSSKAKHHTSTSVAAGAHKANTKVSSVGSSSKKGGATNAPVASGIAGTVKAGPVQVFLNGKIVTPQSLLPRKTGLGHHGKKPKTTLTKPQTIDENSSENAEKPLVGFPSKVNMKRFVISNF